MEPNADQPKAPEAKPGSKPDAKPDAQRRLTQDGPNETKEEKTNPFLKCLAYFWGPIPWMIEVAVVLSGVVGHWEDFGIILIKYRSDIPDFHPSDTVMLRGGLTY